MMMKKKGYKKGGATKKQKIKAQASALRGESRMPFNKKSGLYSDTGDRQQRMFMEKTNKKKSPMKRKPTSTAEAQDTRSRLRGTTGGGKPDVNPAYKKGGKLKKKGYAMGGALKGGQSKLDKNKDGKISGDDFKMMKKKGGGMMKKKGYAMGGMMKKKGMKKGGKVRGSGIARQGVRAAIMV
jgi:hypothetical protein